MNTINASSLTNILLSGQSQMNNLRFSQALAGKNVSAVKPVDKVTNGLSSGDSEFLKTYQEKMTGLLDAAEAVAKGGTASKNAAGSDDVKTAEASGKLQNASDSYTIDVEQLASGQVNRSQAMQSNGTLPSTGGAMRIKTDKGTFDFNLSAAGTKTNEEMLKKYADAINAKNTGVTASVQTKDGKSTLELTGDKTGEASSFAVSGTLAERLGLDQVAQQGQDAVYSVSKNGEAAQTLTSASNSISLESGVTAKLKGTGSAKISAGGGADSSVADAMETLVNRFNDTLSFLNKNEDRGMGVLTQIKRMVVPPASEKSMALAGVTIKNDGSLKFDREAFLTKMDENPSLIKDVTQNIARGVKSDALQGMRTPSAALVGPVQTAQRQTDQMKDPVNFMSMYSRSGVYNVANFYAVGMLMNLNI